ncbi:DUF2922 domain-containing protein [Inconstantimicrobium mannanitabidum]|uniref:Uncharacterized protein n=1 Tax=Inconstantimicrobium mannanitabidum TaxID=1604901 RepID=A0ACB5RIP6_9CLOT|nr:DUF2922 domain-containing protein [Clostridium sp. TW13]GKX68970.1 hypothetical protein rsdtw13_42280 [Clostridium sp. TW13]
MSKTLALVFLNRTQGATKTVNIPFAKDNVTKEEVSKVMDLILDKRMYITNHYEDGVKASARIIKTKTQNIKV